MAKASDEYWMRRAVRLAALGRHASPNPMVGCVIVGPSGVKLAEGFHSAPGQPHAEIVALREAHDLAAGSTVYVTLEPCSHHGRTPPCADALIQAGVARVVIAMIDPDKRVSGRGIGKLLAANIEVDTGVLEEKSRALNRAYIHHRTTGLPWVTVKIASTLDGKTASASGDSRWITGPLTRLWVHRQLRDRHDAILVGINTVLADDPMLTTRLSSGGGRDPIRIIVDSKLRTPLDSRLVRQGEIDGKTIVACLARFAQDRALLYENHGVEILPVPPDENGKVDLRALLTTLGTRRTIGAVLVEGGSTVIASAIAQSLVNRYIAAVAPKLIGGSSAPGAIGGEGLASTIRDAVKVKQWNVRRSAKDLVIDALLS